MVQVSCRVPGRTEGGGGAFLGLSRFSALACAAQSFRLVQMVVGARVSTSLSRSESGGRLHDKEGLSWLWQSDLCMLDVWELHDIPWYLGTNIHCPADWMWKRLRVLC